MQVKIKTILQLCVKINLKRSLKHPGDYYKNEKNIFSPKKFSKLGI